MVIKKYLERYAEPDLQSLNILQPSYFDASLVLPIFDEPGKNIDHFLNFSSAKSLLMIWVFNCPDNACKDSQGRTFSLMSRYIEMLNVQEVDGAQGVYLYQGAKGVTILMVDRCSAGREIPAKQGVGLARKLGMDLALLFIQKQYEDCGKLVGWMHSCDADVHLPDNYFDIAKPEKYDAVALYPFRHTAEPGYEQAMALYDFSLRYYVEQLAAAESPYAFHTIGSLIVVTPVAYAQVRGVPKRSGAEDFYFLNKLAKVGRVKSLEQPVLEVAGRPSERVPFGTGPAIKKIREMTDPANNYTFYHPQIFTALKQLLAIVSDREQSIVSTELLFGCLRDRMQADDAECVISTLKDLKVEKQYQHLSQKKDRGRFIQAFHVWFDAFVTLRFIHIMRDKSFPSVVLAELPVAVRNNIGA